jgi:5'(3')-deoxyribonucleotidase
MKKIIAIDIDDTLTESRNGVRKLANRKLDLELPIEAYSVSGEYWGYYERVWAEHGIKDQLNASELYRELHTDQTLTPLLPGAEYAIKQLLNSFEIVLITSRDKMWKTHTEDWLKEQFGNLAPELYFCESHANSSSETKGQICKKVGAQWLIDDNVDHCLGALELQVEPILFGEYGWHHKKPAGLKNLLSWPEVLEYFESVRD